jgi:Tol biopolymer transport system component/DNA-binding winged helix-turn-helix (wHTH) protein
MRSPSEVRAGKSPAPGRVVRFGVFDAALDAEELRKSGIRIRIPAQSFRILALLLHRPGQVVTREALRKELWPADTFVDFDRCLNTAVNRLREALGDSADNPRYIQTLPRRGYRFVAPVEKSDVAPSQDGERSTLGRLAETKPSRRNRRLWVAVTTLIALAIVATIWAFSRSASAPIGPLRLVRTTGFPGTETTPSLSVDGRQVAFAWDGQSHNNYDIYVQGIDTNKPRQLTSSPAEDFAPSFSPDGKHIAFYRRSGDSSAVYLIPPSGGRTVRLLGLKVGPPGPSTALPADWSPELLAWSPDGKSLAFVDKESPANAFSIWLRRIGATEEQRLTRPPAGSLGDGSPAFSPDGRTLAFVRESDQFTGDIYLVPLTGGKPSRLTADNRKIRGLAWTHDGRDIVFSSDRGGHLSLWRISVSGGAPERLAGVGEHAMFPTISAKGDLLAYVRFAGDTNISRVRLSGGGATSGVTPEKLVGSGGQIGTPRFAPNGRRITYSSNRSGNWEIWISDSEGLNSSRLTLLQSYAGSPCWSPDGRKIAFDSRSQGNWDIYVVGADGGAPRRFTTQISEDVRPSWSSDGRWIYFGSDRSGTAQVWKAPAKGGNPVQVTRHGGYEGVESPDGRFVYYVRRGVPGLWKVPAEGGNETLVLEGLQWENSRNWVVTDKGIYYLTSEGSPPSERKTAIKLFRFDTQRVEPVGSLGEIRPMDMGCSVSPDGQRLLYVQRDETQTDVAVVENFH